MQFINIKDYKTGDTVKALNFGGPKCYKVLGKYVWAPEGGNSLVTAENSITLEPLGLVINNPNIWTVVSNQNIGTANWRITVKNLATNEEKSGVYPFNFSGNVYELECQPGTWVMASCGGYKIESSWSGQQANEFYRLKGTGEIIRYIGVEVQGNQYMAGSCPRWTDYDLYDYAIVLSDIGVVDNSMLQQQLFNEFSSRFNRQSLRNHNGRGIDVRVNYSHSEKVLYITYYVPTTFIGYNLLGGRYASDQELLNIVCFYLNTYQGKHISIIAGDAIVLRESYCAEGGRFSRSYNLLCSAVYV